MAAAMGLEQWYKATHDPKKKGAEKPGAPPAKQAKTSKPSATRGALKRAASTGNVTASTAQPEGKKRRVTTSGSKVRFSEYSKMWLLIERYFNGTWVIHTLIFL